MGNTGVKAPWGTDKDGRPKIGPSLFSLFPESARRLQRTLSGARTVAGLEVCADDDPQATHRCLGFALKPKETEITDGEWSRIFREVLADDVGLEEAEIAKYGGDRVDLETRLLDEIESHCAHEDDILCAHNVTVKLLTPHVGEERAKDYALKVWS